jgi:spermidine/putrescine transport system permease protein
MSPRKHAWPFLAPGVTWFALLFAVPLASIIVVSFWSVANYQLVPGFSFGAWRRVFQPSYMSVLLRTIRVATEVTIASALIGYPVAYYIARRLKRRRVLALTLIALPLWTSYLVRSFAWLLILGVNGVVNFTLLRTGLIAAPLRWLLYSEFAVIVALVHVYIPLFVLPLYAVLDKIDDRLIEAGRDLGASPARIFWTIVFPLSLPGAATGCLFVFIPAAGSYVTPELLGGTNAVMLGSLIAQQFGEVFQYPFGSALALTLMLVLLVVAMAVLWIGRARD